jgi:ATP synthase protein I
MSDDLNTRIGEAQARLSGRNRDETHATAKGMGLGFRMASDFIAAVIVGAGLGWGVDELFGVSPWGLIVCLILGFVTGVRNVVAAAMASQKGAARSGADQGPPETGDPNGKDDGA